MANLVGWKLYRVSDNLEVQSWGGTWGQYPSIPNPLFLPSGDQVHCPEVSVVYHGYELRPWYSSPGQEQVISERDRRLSLGFVFDFGDYRGVHQIGTTDLDMKGWQEVTMASQAAVALGQPETKIAIVTNTGAVEITAVDWQKVLLAASQFRQPIWAASFAIQAMQTIPGDYADDRHWGGA